MYVCASVLLLGDTCSDVVRPKRAVTEEDYNKIRKCYLFITIIDDVVFVDNDNDVGGDVIVCC